MGTWDNTVYLHTSELERVTDALTQLFAKEGKPLVDRPPVRPMQPGSSMQYGAADDNSLWAIAVLSSESWSAIKTAPFDLLCERAHRATRPRLADLTAALGVAGFQLNIYDGDSSILLEATSKGKFRVSGFQASDFDGGDFYPFHDEQIPEANFETGFGLLRASEELVEALHESLEEQPIVFADLLIGPDHPLAELGNSVQVEYLIPHRPLDIPGARELFFGKRKT